MTITPPPEAPLIEPNVPADVESRVIVLMEGSLEQFLITPSDKVTRKGVPVPYDDVMDVLSNRDAYVDLWIDGGQLSEEVRNTKAYVRIFGWRVLKLIKVFMFPDPEDSIQA